MPAGLLLHRTCCFFLTMAESMPVLVVSTQGGWPGWVGLGGRLNTKINRHSVQWLILICRANTSLTGCQSLTGTNGEIHAFTLEIIYSAVVCHRCLSMTLTVEIIYNVVDLYTFIGYWIKFYVVHWCCWILWVLMLGVMLLPLEVSQLMKNEWDALRDIHLSNQQSPVIISGQPTNPHLPGDWSLKICMCTCVCVCVCVCPYVYSRCIEVTDEMPQAWYHQTLVCKQHKLAHCCQSRWTPRRSVTSSGSSHCECEYVTK